MTTRTSRRSRRPWAVFAVAVVVGAVISAPYLLLDPAASRIEVTGDVHYALLVAHVGTALVALVLGPLQFVPAIRARRGWHRRIGRAYLLLGVVPAALAGIPVALLSGRPVTQVGLVVASVAWLVMAALAVRSIRRGDVEGHRAWMTRTYALTFLAVTARALVPLLLFTGAVPLTDVPSAISLGQVLGGGVNLVVAEVLIRRRSLAR